MNTALWTVDEEAETLAPSARRYHDTWKAAFAARDRGAPVTPVERVWYRAPIPKPWPEPGEWTARAITLFKLDNAYLRIKLEDRCLLDQEWATYEGPWVLAEAGDPPTDLTSVTNAAHHVGRWRQTVIGWINTGQIRTYIDPPLKTRRVSLQEVAIFSRRYPMADGACGPSGRHH